MLEQSLWFAFSASAIIAVALAVAYSMYRHSRLSVADRRDLRDAVGDDEDE